MKTKASAVFVLLAGLVAGAAHGQSQPYSGPPGNPSLDPNPFYQRQPIEPYRRPPSTPFIREPDDRYDRNDRYDRYEHDDAPAVDVGLFYDELSPYGEWVRHPQYGWSWFPRRVQAGWRPYSLGRWVESDYGWTWASDEPFGWATYHYGRWAWDREVGWLWVPGTDWGPAWVAWQQGDGYVGWAPLPPAVGFEVGVGIRLGGFSLSVGIAPRDYAFVEERRFLDPGIGRSIVPEARNVTIIHNTTNVTNYTVIDDRVINHGIALERIEQATGRRAPHLRVGIAATARGMGVQRDVLNIYRPTDRALGSVRVARRNNAGLQEMEPLPNRSVEQPPAARPPGGRPTRPAITSFPLPVAPRNKPLPRDNDERQFAREQRDLRASEDNERRALEQLHRQETSQARAKANAGEVEQRHATELQALREQRQRSEQQLQARQQIQRQAEQASAAKAKKPRKPAAEPRKPHKEGEGADPRPPQ